MLPWSLARSFPWWEWVISSLPWSEDAPAHFCEVLFIVGLGDFLTLLPGSEDAPATSGKVLSRGGLGDFLTLLP